MSDQFSPPTARRRPPLHHADTTSSTASSATDASTPPTTLTPTPGAPLQGTDTPNSPNPNPNTTPKKTKIKRALKSAARLPRVPSGGIKIKGMGMKSGLGLGKATSLGISGLGRKGGRGLAPRPGEPPIVVLRIRVVKCEGLLGKDRNGTSSDPFVVLSLPSLPSRRFTTPTIKRTTSPTFPAAQSTFDLPLYLSVVQRVGVSSVEAVVWDKDLVGKDYLGEVGVGVGDWFGNGEEEDREFGFDDPGNTPFTLPIISTRASTPSQGTITLKLGFVRASASASSAAEHGETAALAGGVGAGEGAAVNLMEFDEIYTELMKRGRMSLVSAPPTHGVGTIRSNHTTSAANDHNNSNTNATGPDGAPTQIQYEDDGGLSSDTADDRDDDDDSEEDEDDEGAFVDASDGGAGGSLGPSPLPSPGASPRIGTGAGAGAGGKALLDLYIPPDAAKPDAKGQAKPTKPKLPFAYPLPELNVLPSSPATPTPGESVPTAVPLFLPSVGGDVEETPKASGGFIQPPPASSSGSRFNPKKLVRKLPGLRGGVTEGTAPASPAVDVQGNLVLPGGAGVRRKSGFKGAGEEEDKEERKSKFGQRWREGSSASASASASASGSGSDTGAGGLTPASVPGTPGVEKDSALALAAGQPGETPKRVPRPKKLKDAGGRRKSDFEFKGKNDIVGIVVLEIQGADDLPRLANMTRTGWDMDPFVVISFGKKVFRTRVIRHSRNPVWDEKLLFHVRRYETSFKVQLSVLDWDKLSANDHIGDVSFEVGELVRGAPQPDKETGLYPVREDGEGDREEEGMREYRLPLSTAKEMKWEAKHNPVIRFRAKYQPYDALRQRFWRQYLKQYDTDNTNALSYLELRAMLDSLGSTLTSSTLTSFFTRYGKKPHEEEISVEQAIMCLEEELGRPEGEKKRLDSGSGDGADGRLGDGDITTSAVTPVVSAFGSRGEEIPLELDKLDFSGPVHGEEQRAYTTEPMQMPLKDVATPDLSSDDMDAEAEEVVGVMGVAGSGAGAGVGTPPLVPGGAGAPAAAASVKSKRGKLRFRRASSKKNTGDSYISTYSASTSSSPSPPSTSPNHDAEAEHDEEHDAHPVERIINVRNCPLCHRPRLNSKAEMDIVTHLAVCASQGSGNAKNGAGWEKIDRIMVGNYITASQAQRKWYTKMLGRVGGGSYGIGANSANIIVQNRTTGQLEEEKMQVYVRLGIRLLYKGATSRMEGGRARKLLRSLSIKQGIKYDDPESAKEIPAFIEFHGLKVDEVLDPIDSFKTFNQFFYRRLKPSARPIECPNDPYRMVSAADCRLMTFATVSEATRLWIKGREFSVGKLLGEHGPASVGSSSGVNDGEKGGEKSHKLNMTLAHGGDADRYTGGALAIFRLAPQDYHRFHSPVEGRVVGIRDVEGEYYTVNPQAIRSAIDVYGENARKIVVIDSPQFGRVCAVCVGAMMVGSIKATVEVGDWVERGQEFGYFAFGGSTIVILFEKGRVEWDEDLLINGRASLETLVRVGMGIGRGKPGVSPFPSPSPASFPAPMPVLVSGSSEEF